jgi:TolA-binding protein
MSVQVKFYNPREASPEVLEGMLVGREGLPGEILADLERQTTSRTRQHWLIRGPRGIGKTHLVGIVYHRVRARPELSQSYLPVWLSETDAYEVYSAGTLLLAIARQLVEELRASGDPDVAALEEQIKGVAAAGDDPALFQELCEILKNAGRARRKILLVLMENLDALLAGFAKGRSQQEARRLRSLLSDDHEFLFLSTTPTKYLRNVSDPKAPLYGHLRERILVPLTEEEIGNLFRRLSEVTGHPEKANLLGPDRQGLIRRRVLHRLVGGNPRAAVMAFVIVTGATGIKAMVEEIGALLDAQTAYFEGRLARLAPRERAIVTAMALAPTNLTLQEIAGLTRLEERSLSTQVARLEEEGQLAPAVGDGGKGTIYELTDGLFRLWYQFRKGRKLLLPIVRFLALWYAETELEETISTLRAEDVGPGSPVAELDVFRMSMLQVEEALRLAKSEQGKLERTTLWAECGADLRKEVEPKLPRELAELVQEALRQRETTQLVVAIDRLQEFIRDADQEYERPDLQEQVATAIVYLGLAMERLGRVEQAVATYRHMFARFGSSDDPALLDELAHATMHLAVALGRVGRHEEAVATFRDLISRCETRDRPSLKEQVAWAMVRLGIALGELGRHEEAVATFRDLISRFEASDQPPLQEEVARAMLNLGVALRRLGRSEEAAATYHDLISRFEASEQPALQVQVARAMVNLGVGFGRLDRHEEAATYRNVVTRFSASDDPNLLDEVAHAMLHLGIALGELGRLEEAAATFHDLIARFGAREQPALQAWVAIAMVNLGFTLRKLGGHEEAVGTFRDFIARFGASEQPTIQEGAARAMVNLGIALGELGRLKEAAATFRDLISRFGASEQPALQAWVAAAMLHLGIALGELGRPEEAAEMYRDLIARFGTSDQPVVQEGVARATVNLGVALGRLGRNEEAAATYRDLIARFGTSAEPVLQGQVAKAMVLLGVNLGQLGRPEEEAATYRDLIAQFGTNEQPALQEGMARAMVNLGVALGQLGRLEEAAATYRDLIARFGTSDQPVLQEGVARAMINLGITLGQLNRPEEEAETFNNLLTLFGESRQPEIRTLVTEAKLFLAIVLVRQGKTDDAEGSVSEWVADLVKEPASRVFPLDDTLRKLIAIFRLELVRTWIESLEACERSKEVSETARLYRFVLDALAATEQSTPADRGKGPAARLRKALGRVPPELRATVKEIAEKIREERRARAARSPQTT